MKTQSAVTAGNEYKARRSRVNRAVHSLIAKFVIMVLVFFAVPALLYQEFRQADLDRQNIVLTAVREQGRLMAESLRPMLEKADPSSLLDLPEEIERIATKGNGIKVLFRPAGEEGVQGVFFVASEPRLSPDELRKERKTLVEQGVFDNLTASCLIERPMAIRHLRPSGLEELLTSMTAIQTDAGCWAVIATQSAQVFLGSSIGQPYWKTLEVQIASAIYLGMALILAILVFTVWRDLARFRDLARGIREGRVGKSSFTFGNKVPELEPVAYEFDRMTHTLRESSDSIRRAAEDNAHAFKTPLAIIRQALEPLNKTVEPENKRAQRALQVVEEALDRLENLVSTARHLEHTSAELLNPPRENINLSALLLRMLEAYNVSFSEKGVILQSTIDHEISVLAGEDMLETILENIIDNALEVSPRGTTVTVDLINGKKTAELAIRDRGPGVPESEIERIFERYVSYRQRKSNEDKDEQINPGSHMGIGLWIVRRNVEAIGGYVRAENRQDGGLSIIVSLPQNNE
ncbi:sensor histidine kinase [Kiloniella sp.]|uniref:sensor histidine kinase n=1 Tax=Kiloniella sp. TaxID=1938587 RepID=UPI003B013C6D